VSLLRRLRERGIRPSRLRGQSFLVDEGVLGAVADAAGAGEADTVVEIGAGPGNLTRLLARNAGRVIAVEVDRGLVEFARENLADLSNVEVVEGDARRLDLSTWTEAGAPKLIVVGNLPYSVTTPVIMRVLEQCGAVRRCVFTVQKEVAARMAADPGGRQYGALSVAVQYRADVEIVRTIAPEAFRPVPAVTSALVRLGIKDRPSPEARDERALRAVVSGAFSQRRKKLVNSLAGALHVERDEAVELLRRAGLNPDDRAERVSVAGFVRLADAWFATQQHSGESE
jgi:16S rRNA (adenine1518-N6/adenine1519-N6)-dimethyltransferase